MDKFLAGLKEPFLLAAGVTTDSRRAIGSAVLGAGLPSALRKVENRS